METVEFSPIDCLYSLREEMTVDPALIEYTKERLAARLGDRNARVGESLSVFQHALTMKWSVADTLAKQNAVLQHVLQITAHPPVINAGTEKGILFDMTVEWTDVASVDAVALENGRIYIPAKVDVFAISISRYDDLQRKEEHMLNEAEAMGTAVAKDWFIKELQKHMRGEWNKHGDVIPLSVAKGEDNFGWLNKLVNDPNTGTKKYISEIKNVRFDKVPPVPAAPSPEPNPAARKKSKSNSPSATPTINQKGTQKPKEQANKSDRSADSGYYLVAIVPQLGMRAYSLPVCFVTHANQYGKCAGSLFWHDACSHKRHLELPAKINCAGSALICGLPEHVSEQMSIQDFKLYISWYFRLLVGDLVKTGLSEMSLEFLVRKALGGPEAEHVACGHSCPDGLSCSICDLSRGPMTEENEMLYAEYISWTSFEKMHEWFYKACKFIKFLEEQAFKEAEANKAAGCSGNSSQCWPGLWDSGIIQLLSRTQVCKLLRPTHSAVLCDPMARQLLLRISESDFESLSIYSVSNRGRIVPMKALKAEFFQKIPLANALYCSAELRRFKLTTIFPGVSLDQLIGWCQVADRSKPSKNNATKSKTGGDATTTPIAGLAPYVLSPIKLPCTEFIRELDDAPQIAATYCAMPPRRYTSSAIDYSLMPAALSSYVPAMSLGKLAKVRESIHEDENCRI